MSFLSMVQIEENRRVAPEVYRMVLRAPDIARAAKPGQFLHIRVNDSFDPLLRRPISINGADRKAETVSLLYRIAGGGTKLLAGEKAGQTLDVLGPLGNGFSLKTPSDDASLAVIAGGIGVAPIYFLLQGLQELGVDSEKVLVFLGSQTKDAVLLKNEIGKMGYAPLAATDDGSDGYRGLVTDLFAKTLREKIVSFAYSCGPPAMLKEVATLLQNNNISGEISLEENMACGLGACLSCVCKIKGPGSEVTGRQPEQRSGQQAGRLAGQPAGLQSGRQPEQRSGQQAAQEYTYQRVCTEGPVFSVGEVFF